MFKRSFFYRYLAPRVWALVGNVVLRLLSAICNLALVFGVAPFLSILFKQTPDASQKPLDGFSSQAVLNQINQWLMRAIELYGQVATLSLIVVAIALLYVFKNFLAYLASARFVGIKNRVLYDLRRDVFHRLLILPVCFYSGQRKGDLLARLTTDIQEIDNNILQQIDVTLIDGITTLALLVTLVYLNPFLMGITMLILPIAVFLITFSSKNLRRSAPELQAVQGRLFAQTEETLGGLKMISAANAESRVLHFFDKTNREVFRRRNHVLYRVDLASPLSELVGTTAVMAILLVGGSMIFSPAHRLAPELLITFLLCLSQILNPLKNISSAFYSLRRGKASVRRIKDILYAEEKIEERSDAQAIDGFQHSIRFENVAFSYDETPLLSNFSFTFEKNRSYAIVGPSGAGKSTLCDLMLRFYDVSAGQILVDHIPITDLKISSLRKLSAIVAQETILFNDTIFNNIAFGMPDARVEQVEAAAHAACAHDFIAASEKGYQTIIGDSGMKLSGGQRQRISLARAILKQAPILILDEATSALDSESEKLVQQAIDGMVGDRTIIAIAHRLSTIRKFDTILVLDHGQILECGSHDQLMAKKGLYADLVGLQSV